MIPSLPNSLQIIAAENSVFRRMRSGLLLETDLGEFSNAAQVVLGYFQNIEPSDLQSLYEPKTAAQIIAAGRILDTASEELLTTAASHDGNLEIAVATGLLAAIANAIYGNFPAAWTIARRFVQIERSLSAFQLCAFCCCAPELAGKFLPFTRSSEPAMQFLENLETFLRTGEITHERLVRESFLALRSLLNQPFDHSVWLSCEVCLEQLITLALAKTLKEILGDSAFHYVELLAKSGLKTLLPPQFLAIKQSQLIGSPTNGVICLPTSTGKTLLSELCIYSSVKELGRIGVFVTPYVALGRQVANGVEQRLPDDWKIIRLFGGFKEPGAIATTNQKLFIVATPERLDALLRYSPELLSRIDCVVFDEAHLIENGQRGARLEGVIARILLAQKAWKTGRVILISAVIPNAPEVASWIGATSGNVVNYSWTPNSRRIAVWRPNGQLVWHHSNDPVSPDGATPDQPIASITLPWPRQIVPTNWSFQENVYFESDNYDNLVYLCAFMWTRVREPVLCVCATRDTTRQTAARLAKRFDAIEPLPSGIQNAIDLIVTKYPHYSHLRKALLSGVAYHNASLPHDLRAALEESARAKELRCVVSTTTLAEGVDLPFRVTVIADWLRYNGNTQVPYSPLLVRNIAGRCGRVGYFTEGDIVIYDNPLGAHKFKAPGRKEDWQQKVFFSKGDLGVQSGLEVEFDDFSVKATLASQFLASIAENPGNEHIEHAFTEKLFAASTSRQEQIEPFINRVVAQITSPDWLLATRNSPIALTPLGFAVNRSGFSPSSCQKILKCLESQSVQSDAISLAAKLLTELGDLPEQGDSRFRKLAEREKRIRESPEAKKTLPPKLYVRIEFLPGILKDWSDGKLPIEIFASLPLVKDSKRKPPFADWLAGTEEVTSWDSEFDKFCEFLRTTVFEFLPSLLHAVSLLSPYASTTDWTSVDWSALAGLFQRDSAITSRDDIE